MSPIRETLCPASESSYWGECEYVRVRTWDIMGQSLPAIRLTLDDRRAHLCEWTGGRYSPHTSLAGHEVSLIVSCVHRDRSYTL